MNTHVNHKNKMILVAVLVVIIVFYAGIKYGESKNTSALNQTANRANGSVGGAVGRGMRNGGGLVSGSVVSVDTTSMTIKLNDNTGSRIVLFGATTPVMKSVSGTSADIVVGKNVMITGQANTDGSINAQSIQLRDTVVK